MKRQACIASICLLISIFLSACGPLQVELDAEATQVAANLAVTQTAEAPPPTSTPLPTQTPTPSPSPPAPTPTATSTPLPPPAPTSTPAPSDTPTLTPLPATPTLTPAATDVPAPAPSPTAPPVPFTPTPATFLELVPIEDPALRLAIVEAIRQAQPLGGDKNGLILVNCHEAPMDWYIEQPIPEKRLVTTIPGYSDDHCGSSHLEALYASTTYMFGFSAEGLRGTGLVRKVNVPAGQVAVLYVRFPVSQIQFLGTLEELQAALSSP